MAIAKPRNLREAAAVESAMRRKYPGMYDDSGRIKPEYKGKKVRKAKSAKEQRRKAHGIVKTLTQKRAAEDSALREALTGEEMRRLLGR